MDVDTWVRVVISTALAACSSSTPTARERALERIPAQAQLILAADGPALATTTFRRVVDSLTPHLPPSLACVVEAATTSQAIAVGVQLHAGTTIVLVTRATVDHCPALSRIASDTWTATIGAGTPAVDRGHSVLAAPTWARARPYLAREPVAVAAELPDMRLVGVAQPEPIDAWLTIDAAESAGVERTIKAMVDRWRAPPTRTGSAGSADAIDLAAKLELTRKGTQVSVQADGLVAEDFVTMLGDTLRLAEPSEPVAAAATFACPSQPVDGIVSCHDGTQYKVRSVEETVTDLASLAAVPVIEGGDIVGVRISGDPGKLFARGDVILGLDSHRITDPKQFKDLAGHLDGKASIAVRRGRIEGVLQLTE